MSPFIVVLVTCGSEEEAAKIAHSLVENRLAACVNLVPSIRSIYQWEEKILDEKECLMIIKTRRERFEELKEKVKLLHSYSVPEIICFPIINGTSSYLQWLEKMTQ